MKNLLKAIDLTTVAGVGIGVAIGLYGFKYKKPLPLILFGIGGGLASTYGMALLRPPKPIELAEENLAQLKMDIEETIEEPQGMEFNETVGYMMPTGTLDPISAKEDMELSFNA